MNKTRQKAILTPETPGSHFFRGIDVVVGDVVQVRPPGHDAGRIGRVIGVSYYKKIKDLRFTVVFSDNESALFSGERLNVVRTGTE